jgi:hypothetical protein
LLQVTQQLPDYGVLVHQVFPEKKRLEGEMALGVCAKGVIVYEVKNNSRIATAWFLWRETGKISTCVSAALLISEPCFVFLCSVAPLKEQWLCEFLLTNTLTACHL